MRPGDDRADRPDDGSELRVTDKRRFTAEGDIRDDGAAEDEAAPVAPAPNTAPAAPAVDASALVAAAAPAAPERPASPAPEPPPEGARNPVFDLGIEAVFYVFYQSALIALGASQPGGPPGHVDLAEARQAITFLKILEDKTRGNLTAEETATVAELLSEAQMAYVQVARSVAGGGA